MRKKKSVAKSTPCCAGLDKSWQTEDDLRTIRRAEEIKADKSRINAVKSLVSKEQKALQKLSDATSKAGR